MSSLDYRRGSPRWPAEPRRGGGWLLIGLLAFNVAVWTVFGLFMRHVLESEPQGSPLVSYFGAPATSVSPK
jgi:hypothetical protein